jgi:hypothetical protein
VSNEPRSRLVEVPIVAIPDDIAYPVWAADDVLVETRWGQRGRIELDSIRWPTSRDRDTT